MRKKMKLLLENWRKYLREESRSSLRVYHGSPDATFTEFELRPPTARTTDYGWFGDGLYVDTSMRQALSYPGGTGPEVVDENVERIEKAVQGDKSNLIPGSGAVRIRNREDDPKAGVFVLDLTINNPYEWSGSGIPAIIQNPYLNQMPPDIADAVAEKMEYPSWEELVKAIESSASAEPSRWEQWLADSATRAIKDLGHDSVQMTRSNGGAEIVVFDPSNLENVLR